MRFRIANMNILFLLVAIVALMVTIPARSQMQTAPSSTLRNGLAAWFPLNDDGHKQSRVNGLLLTNANFVQRIPGRVRYGSQFTAASSQRLSTSAQESFWRTGNSNYTFAFWTRLTAKPSAGGIYGLFAKDDSGSTNREYVCAYVQSIDRFIFNNYEGTSSSLSCVAVANTFGAISTNTWYLIVCGYDLSQGKTFIGVNGGPLDYSSAAATTPGVNTNSFTVGCDLVNDGGRYLNGDIDEFGFWRRLLTSNEISTLYRGVTWPMFNPSQPFSIETPGDFQIFQQQSGGTTNIPVFGFLPDTSNRVIEARFNSGAWTPVATNSTGLLYYSGVVSNVSGQGLFETRFQESPLTVRSRELVGVGDVFLIAGQSNAGGRGSNVQSFASATFTPGLFGNDYKWKLLSDPTDSFAQQTDAVSDDATSGPPFVNGSVWPLLATHILTNRSYPIAFIPAALGGSLSSQWQISGAATNRDSLIGSAIWRAKVAGGVKAVLWWQGEGDAGWSVSSNTYYANFTNITSTFQANLGAKTIPCKFQFCTGGRTLAQQEQIWTAIENAWLNDPNTIQGPDLSDLSSDDSAHLMSDAKLSTAAKRWWDAIKSGFSW